MIESGVATGNLRESFLASYKQNLSNSCRESNSYNTSEQRKRLIKNCPVHGNKASDDPFKPNNKYNSREGAFQHKASNRSQ